MSRIEEIRAREQAATPGPIDVHKSKYDLTLGGHHILVPGNGEAPPLALAVTLKGRLIFLYFVN